MSDNKQERKKSRGNNTAFELTEKTQSKAAALLDDMLAKVKARVPLNPALALVKQNIEKIDELNKEGATLAQIFEHMNKGLKLGISASSFVQYVRRIRQETGSDLYVKREKGKSKTEARSEAAPSARAETMGAPDVMAETAAAAGWNCAECETRATRRESSKHPGKFYWRCAACGTNYLDDNGELSNERAK